MATSVLPVISVVRDTLKRFETELITRFGLTQEQIEKALEVRDEVRFFKKGKYFEFSNFYPVTVEFEGKIYPSTEHIFQAHKFVYPGAGVTELEFAESIRLLPTALLAFRAGKSRKVRINPKWEVYKVVLMKKIVRVKFSQVPLRALLLSTGKKSIVENSPYDSFWGAKVVRGKPGRNMLGQILEEVREEMR